MSTEIGYEIDFLPVDSGEHSGDAIALRYGRPDHYEVIVYDGGTKASGQALVDHIQKYYKTDTIDYVVCSHPDVDHASGLSVVLENLRARQLWMHRPWVYSGLICDYFKDGRLTSKSLAERLKQKMVRAHALEELASKKSIPIREPYYGAKIGEFLVLSPNKDWYVHSLIPAFGKSPDPKQLAADRERFARVEKAVSWIVEAWGYETLREGLQTSAENDSSVVLFAQFDGRGVLLTGDAGVKALSQACDAADAEGLSLPDVLKFVQMPHHGGRRNVSPSVLNRILGSPRDAYGGGTDKTAFVSASKGSSSHPRKAVVNAFIRRGTKVISTSGSSIRHHHGMPSRDWVAATSLGFSGEVEDWG